MGIDWNINIPDMVFIVAFVAAYVRVEVFIARVANDICWIKKEIKVIRTDIAVRQDNRIIQRQEIRK